MLVGVPIFIVIRAPLMFAQYVLLFGLAIALIGVILGFLSERYRKYK
jgi:hypothetical protein